MDLSYSERDQRRYAEYQDAVHLNAEIAGTIPHCDARILHNPDECCFCDRADLQAVRNHLRIAWTGYEPGPTQIPCEADLDRPVGSTADYNRWHGNVPAPFKATKEEKAFVPWYMKPVCRNDDGTTIGADFKWWTKPFKRWLW